MQIWEPGCEPGLLMKSCFSFFVIDYLSDSMPELFLIVGGHILVIMNIFILFIAGIFLKI